MIRINFQRHKSDDTVSNSDGILLVIGTFRDKKFVDVDRIR